MKGAVLGRNNEAKAIYRDVTQVDRHQIDLSKETFDSIPRPKAELVATIEDRCSLCKRLFVDTQQNRI